MKIRHFLFFVWLLPAFSACKNEGTTKLLYQGHASFRLTAKNGAVLYIDPYAKEGYDLPADIILVTHGHWDHNIVELVTQKKKCVVIANDEAQKGGKYNTFNIKGIKIEAVEAYMGNHDRRIGVGYVITIDGIKLYHTGDSTLTDQMKTLPEKKLDYALIYCGGVPETASGWAEIIGAKHNIPMHHSSQRGVWFDKNIADRFTAPGRLIVEPGEEIELIGRIP